MSEKKHPHRDPITLLIEDRLYETLPTPKFKKRKPYIQPDPKKVICFIPGIIGKIYVASGTRVAVGERLMMLEAMKMQNDIVAHRDGKIKSIHVNEGKMATKGQILMEYE